MVKTVQRILLVLGIGALLFLLTEIALSIAMTRHSGTPARIVQVMAGPYPLTVSLYKNPANAGFALPFAIAPAQPISGTLIFDVTALPDKGVDATPIRSSITSDAQRRNGIQGAAEITVQGLWNLQVSVTGPLGRGVVDIPITATAPSAIPPWLGWVIGYIPFYGLLVFVLSNRPARKMQMNHLKRSFISRSHLATIKDDR